MDRGYIDIAQFQRLTEEGVCYVTKMKKNRVTCKCVWIRRRFSLA